jgi:hypothetical protein
MAQSNYSKQNIKLCELYKLTLTNLFKWSYFTCDEYDNALSNYLKYLEKVMTTDDAVFFNKPIASSDDFKTYIINNIEKYKKCESVMILKNIFIDNASYDKNIYTKNNEVINWRSFINDGIFLKLKKIEGQIYRRIKTINMFKQKYNLIKNKNASNINKCVEFELKKWNNGINKLNNLMIKKEHLLFGTLMLFDILININIATDVNTIIISYISDEYISNTIKLPQILHNKFKHQKYYLNEFISFALIVKDLIEINKLSIVFKKITDMCDKDKNNHDKNKALAHMCNLMKERDYLMLKMNIVINVTHKYYKTMQKHNEILEEYLSYASVCRYNMPYDHINHCTYKVINHKLDVHDEPDEYTIDNTVWVDNADMWNDDTNMWNNGDTCE